jgi:hypothetical protein
MATAVANRQRLISIVVRKTAVALRYRVQTKPLNLSRPTLWYQLQLEMKVLDAGATVG